MVMISFFSKRTICTTALACLLWATWSAGSQAQVEIGNGGDAVICRPETDAAFVGYYSLDYLLTWGTGFGSQDSIPVANWGEGSLRIRALLAEKAPDLLNSFEDFRLLVGNTDKYYLYRIWEPAPFGLVDISDENMVALVPANCRETDKISIVQTVIRQDPDSSGGDSIVYRFVPDVVDEMNRNSPLQLSYLYVHEWLWDISKNVDRNRRVNAFLHSKRAADMSASEFFGQLRGMGIEVNNVNDPFFLDCASPRYPDKLTIKVYPHSPRHRFSLQFSHVDASGTRERTAILSYNRTGLVDPDGIFQGRVAGGNDEMVMRRRSSLHYSVALSPVGLDDIIDFECDRR